MLAISCASSTSPPPLPRRSNTMPCAPRVQRLVRPLRALPRARPGLKVASATTPIFFPFTVRIADATTGSEIVARVIVTVRRGGVGTLPLDRELHVGARQPLDQRDRLFRREPVQRAAVDGDDHIPHRQPGARRRRGVEHVRDQQAAALGTDRHSDPGEVRRRVEFSEFARCQVVREAVAEARRRRRRWRRSRACWLGSGGSSRARSAESLRRRRASGGRRRRRRAGSAGGLRDAHRARGLPRAGSGGAPRARS